MKKNLLTFLFVIAFVCVGTLVVSAKTPSSSENSANVSKRLVAVKTFSNKTKAVKAKCNAAPCDGLRDNLIALNTIYDNACGPAYLSGCEPDLAGDLQRAGGAYENCLNGGSPELAVKTDRAIDRNKSVKSRVLSSE